jgi:hypothetical protein
MKIAARLSNRNFLATGVGALLFVLACGFAADADNEIQALAGIVGVQPSQTADQNSRSSSAFEGAITPEQDPSATSQIDAESARQKFLLASAALPPFKPSEGSELWVSRTSAVKHKAALELTRQGEARLRSGDADQALSLFEKALGLESSPYVYISIARAHYVLGHYSESLSFIDVAESWLKQQSDSVPEVTAFKARVPGSGLTEQIFPEHPEAADQG